MHIENTTDWIGKKTLYELAGFNGKLFLIASFIEIFFLLKKKERIFVPLRLVNLLWLRGFLAALTQQIEQKNTSWRTRFANIANKVHRIFLGDMIKDSHVTTLFGFTLIRIALWLSIVALVVYLYLRFVKKYPLNGAPLIEGLDLASVKRALAYDRKLAIAAILLMVAPFFHYVTAHIFDVRARLYGFSTRPYSAFLAFLMGASLLIMLSRGDTKYKDICIIVALVTFLRLNPIYILRLGPPGLGYIAYVVALVMAVCCLIEKRYAQPEV